MVFEMMLTTKGPSAFLAFVLLYLRNGGDWNEGKRWMSGESETNKFAVLTVSMLTGDSGIPSGNLRHDHHMESVRSPRSARTWVRKGAVRDHFNSF